MIEIKETTENDLKSLEWLSKQNYYGEDNSPCNYNGMIEKFCKLSKDKNYKFVSAVDGDALVGFACAIVNQFIVEVQRPAIMVWDLRVHPDYRKRGIGSAIIKYIENYGKTINAELVGLACDTANIVGCKFYGTLGYRSNCSFFYKHFEGNK